MKGALVFPQPADDMADAEQHEERHPERDRAQQCGAERQRAAIQRDDANPHEKLAERLARDRVQHRRIRDGKHEREEADRAHRALAVAAEPRDGNRAQQQLSEGDHDEIDGKRDEPHPEAGGAHDVPGGAIHGAYNTRMISVRDGQAQILARIGAPLAPELLPLTRGVGRVLAEDFAAPFDVPPADNSAVDGYAVGSADIPARGTRELIVVGDLAAGAVFDRPLGAGQALRIMTGAPIPAGADTVYPQEVVERDADRVRVGAIERGVNVRRAGEDVVMGKTVVDAGTVLRPQEIGLLASLGVWQVAVRRRPRVALMSTGDEVAEPGTSRRPGQIYDANRFTLRGAIEQNGGEITDLGIVPDVRDTLRATLHDAARAADVVITSGGVSVGVYDLVKDVLQELGSIDFWQVAMQPGRPFAVGRIGSALFFGLPGNPVASLLSFMLFVRPALFKLAGRRRLFPATWQARALEPMRKKPGRTEYKRGVLAFRDGQWEVCTTGPQGSGILFSMVAGNCFVVLDEARGDVQAGEPVTVEPFDTL